MPSKKQLIESGITKIVKKVMKESGVKTVGRVIQSRSESTPEQSKMLKKIVQQSHVKDHRVGFYSNGDMWINILDDNGDAYSSTIDAAGNYVGRGTDLGKRKSLDSSEFDAPPSKRR